MVIAAFLFSLGPKGFTNQTFANSTKISPQVAKSLQENQGVVPVIVQAHNGLTKEIETQVINKGGKLKRELGIIKGFSAELTAAAIEQLARDTQVVRITYDNGAEAQLDVAIPTVGADVYWNLGYTGQGVTVAVIDSGIYPHPDLNIIINLLKVL